MQPLIQDIFSQIIDSSYYFPTRFCDFSCMKFPFKTKQKVLSYVNSFWSEIYKKCKVIYTKYSKHSNETNTFMGLGRAGRFGQS